MSISSRINTIEEHIGDIYDTLELGGFDTIVVPDEYKQLEYIESSGTQYIDTGFKPKGDTSAIIDGIYTPASDSASIIFGCQSYSAPNYLNTFAFGNGTSSGYNYISKYDTATNSATETSDFYSGRKQYKMSKNNVYVNDTLITSFTAGTFTCTYNGFIFALNYNGVASNYANLKLYSCMIYDDSTLVRNFIPCIRKSDSVIGLYDTVNNVFYTNAGTGTFIAGPVVFNKNIQNIPTVIKDRYKDYLANGTDTLWNNWEKVTGSGTELKITNTIKGKMDVDVKGNTVQPVLPPEYQALEYIESSGTQYISTLYRPNQTTRCVVDMMYTGDSSGWIIGARTSSSSTDQYGLIKSSSDGPNIVRSDYYNLHTNITNLYTNTRYTIDKNKNKVYVNGSLQHTVTASNFQTAYSLFIFGLGTAAGSTFVPGILRLYSCKIYNNDILIRDFVPCYRLSDNVIGLYDLVNNVFYTNAGTGSFTYGATITLPNPVFPIEVENVSGEVEVKVANSFANYEYTTENTKNWTTNATIFQYGKINSNKMLAIVYTDYTKATGPSLALRGLIGGTYSGNNKELTAIKINNKWCYYGYLTPIATETKYWITNGNSNINNLHSKLYVYDATEFEISDEDLLKFMANPVDVYEEQTATFPLAEGQVLHLGDILEDDGIHQIAFEKVLDGTENWAKSNSNNIMYATLFNDSYINKLSIQNLLCTHFVFGGGTYNSSSAYNLGNNIFSVNNGSGTLGRVYYFRDDNITSVDDFKAFLAQQYANGTPVKLELKLTNPTVIPYTAEQQTAYDNLKNLYSYKGTTHISSSNEPSPVFEVVALKDIA